MKRKNGFTLMELLIAAAILGVLALFATQAFRKSSSDIRVEDAKVRAKAIAMAARRFKLDHPNPTFSLDAMGSLTRPDSTACLPDSAVTLQMLVDCGYLDYRQYAVEREGEDAEQPFVSYFNFKFDSSGNVCIRKASEKIAMGDNEVLCTDGEGPFWSGS